MNLVVMLSSLVFLAAGEAAPKRPNVLFIAVDDLNDWIGCLDGPRQVHTPNFDRLAASGVLFTNAHCAAPSCNPSRVATLTGMRPTTTGIYFNDQKFRKLLPDVVTLPQFMTAHGYHVLGGGKIFHGGDRDPRSWPGEYLPQPRDPDRKLAYPKDPHGGLPGTGSFQWGPLAVADEQMGDAKVAAWAAKQLRANPKEPFFLAVGFWRPHLPWKVPAEYFERHPIDSVSLPEIDKDDLADIPAMGQTFALYNGDNYDIHGRIEGSGQWKRAVQSYIASVEFVDRMLGQVLDALEASSARDNTIIVLWSDHGQHLGEKRHWTKFVLWEKATRVPLMIAGPGIKRGVRCEQPVSLLDLYPTLAQLCGEAVPEQCEGVSLLPLLQNPTATRTEPAVISWGPGNHAVRDQRWRLIRYSDGSKELYDHQADPNEWTNLARNPAHDATIERLATFIPQASKPFTGKSKFQHDADKTSKPASVPSGQDRPLSPK